MSLRLGVVCAVIDEDGRILLSERGDLNIWNLPGGRLDSGEFLSEAAAREVQEETGIEAHVERPVNLYYWQGFQRLNILYAGWPVGGRLQPRTSESLDNQYFAPDSLPKMLNPQQVQDALAVTRPKPDIIAMTPDEMRRIKRRLGVRWVQNLMQGNPEPAFPHFHVRAVAVIYDKTFQRVLTVAGDRGQVLPRVSCSGLFAPWEELRERLKQHCRVNPALQWAGVWQDAPRNLIELVFAAAVPEAPLPLNTDWSNVQNAALGDRDMRYVERVDANFNRRPVWSMIADDDLGGGDILWDNVKV